MSETAEWEPPQGWVKLSNKRWSPVLTFGGTGLSFFVVYFVADFLGEVAADLPAFAPLPAWLRALMAACAVLILGVILLLIVDRLFPQPAVQFETGQVRVGRRVLAISSLRKATLISIDTRRGARRTLTLVIEGGKMKIGVVLREKSWMLEPESRRRLAEVLRRSSVAMPVSKDDPTGRFARYNFPGSLSKEDAIAVVLDPPGPGEPLPILGGTPVADRLRRID